MSLRQRMRAISKFLLRLSENAHLSRFYRDYPHPRPVEFSLCETAKPIQQGKSLRRTQKVKGRRWKPLGRELGAERAEGKNCLKSFVFVLNLEPCAFHLRLIPRDFFTFAALGSVPTPSGRVPGFVPLKTMGWTFSISL